MGKKIVEIREFPKTKTKFKRGQGWQVYGCPACIELHYGKGKKRRVIVVEFGKKPNITVWSLKNTGKYDDKDFDDMVGSLGLK